MIPTAEDGYSHEQESKRFFFEKKKQKTFIPWHSASRRNLRGCQSGFTAIKEKFFASFFKMTCLLPCFYGSVPAAVGMSCSPAEGPSRPNETSAKEVGAEPQPSLLSFYLDRTPCRPLHAAALSFLTASTVALIFAIRALCCGRHALIALSRDGCIFAASSQSFWVASWYTFLLLSFSSAASESRGGLPISDPGSPLGGLGLLLVRRTSDQFTYCRQDERNQIRVLKRVRRDAR